ncbi:hypothetical protein PoB_003357600 [Plakobranchus ocellatus]|uniref:Uncharacterized protein n=1 Tax=Plakobranchus ocellatus TaxID=259542 RepID=A0AAV4AFI5_9GAST|nr:hypothetical protein PoB_003357600 [Plakobranchus ocellatus]
MIIINIHCPVRTHLLEVELATQFSPELFEDQEKLVQTLQECELTLEGQCHKVENATSCSNSICETLDIHVEDNGLDLGTEFPECNDTATPNIALDQAQSYGGCISNSCKEKSEDIEVTIEDSNVETNEGGDWFLNQREGERHINTM